jgi:hypothetical protein
MQAVIQSIKPVSIENEQTGEKTETYEIVAYVPDHEAMVTFNLNDYNHFAHAYAVTGWKSQGNTLDWVLAKFSKHMDAHGLYVILTRHREEISMYYSKEDFSDFKSLVHSFSRINVKDLVWIIVFQMSTRNIGIMSRIIRRQGLSFWGLVLLPGDLIRPTVGFLKTRTGADRGENFDPRQRLRLFGKTTVILKPTERDWQSLS